MTVINTNVKALYTQAAMKTSGRDLENAMQQLSTGKRINSARDDAAGMAIATRMTQQIRSLNQAVRNAGDAISLIQTTEGATAEITDMLQRMRELAIQAINDTNSGEQRSYLDLEFQQLKQEIVRISNTTEWNGFSVLDGTAGYAVGERPVYKTTSEADFDSVFINPTTSRAISGDTAGEYQVVTMSGTASADGTITIGGVDVNFKSGDTAEAIAVKAGQALRASDDFAASTGRKVVVSGAEIQITYGVGEKDVLQVTTSAAVSGVTATASSPIRTAAVAQVDKLLLSGTHNSIAANDVITLTVGGNPVSVTVDAGDLGASADVTLKNLATKVALAYNASTDAAHTGITAAAGNGSISGGTAIANVAGGLETATYDLTTLTLNTSGDTITIEGLTFTSDGNASSADVLAALSGGGVSNGTIGGTLNAGWTVSVNGNNLILTSTSKADVTDAGASTGTNTITPTVVDGVPPVAQVETISLANNFVAGQTVSMTVNGTAFSYVVKPSDIGASAAATQQAVAEAIKDAFNASIETAHTSITAGYTAGATSLTLTADVAGTAFTVASVSAEAGVISLTADTAGEAFSASVSATQAAGSDIAAVRSEVQKNLDKATGDAITSADENFTANGAFLRSGLLNITTTFENSVTGVTARFTTSDGEVVAMSAELDVAAGTVTLKQALGDNAKIISDDLTYTFKDPTGAVEELGGRKLSLDVAVPGTIPAMSTGDLVINGVVIGASYTADDPLSPPNNASGSAIAKAAAINRYTEETGVFAVVNENIMGGAPQSGTSIVTGRVVINGIESSLITTVLNNTRESRAATITAINQIADKTGVRAIDTEDDDEGVRLLARDGRNIEVRFVTGYPITDFGARTGLREGVQAGTYSLETKVEGELVVTTTDTGVIERSGLKLGDFTKNESTLGTAARKPITNGQTPVALNAGDLVINGVSIRGAMTSDDKSTDPIALVTDSNIRAASAVAIAAAINASTEQTGVRATANPVVLESDLTTIDASRTDGRYKLWVNGAEVEVEFRQTHTASERVNAVIAAITPKFGATGIVAEANAKGGLTLTTQDGRNLSVWFDDTQDAEAGATTLKPEEFGLAMVSTGKAAEGVTSKTDAATIANASTLYGGITLHSEKAFTIEPGGNGYAERSNFTALGFQEGTFGGEVDEATTKMSPPRTGRLTFHVGASAGQVITIDLADFGSGGPVTGDITNDVAAGDGANRVNRIDSATAASAVLEKLDIAMDKVNATRGRMGAVMNRLEHVIDNLMNVSMHSEASRSQIEDADYAAASTELARTQIMQQAATAVLAQANASQQNVLSLLQ